jgi:glycosyltransferase involved in cell wall biosynthesis
MESKKPLLSICIPTYNRGEYLDKVIASIVSQEEFSGTEVELVVSDNASIDNTEDVVKKYQERYKNIFYFKNSRNLADRNFPIVLGNARGVFRKLCGDRYVFDNKAIRCLLEVINKNLGKKPVLFFMNCSNKRERREYYITDNFDSFVKIVSFWSTNITCFGIWEDDFDKLKDMFDGCSVHLWQTKTLFETVVRRKEAFIDNRRLYYDQDITKKDLSYGLFDVFYKNYLGLFHEYTVTRVLSDSTFKYLRKRLLFDFFLSWLVRVHYDCDKYVISSNENLTELIMNEYRGDIYFFEFCFKLKKIFFLKYIRRICRKIGLFK